MNPSIAIIGMACIYPDAHSPGELWENVLAQRRAFRRIPPERLRLADYFSADPSAPDRTYATEGAVIEGYEFDRVAFRVVGSTFRSADLAHWLALDVASRVLADAGFPDGQGLPHETTGVLLGNSLTGEFSRANLMRLRWPYVRRVLEAALVREDWPSDQRERFLADLENEYKAPFPPVGEETLAGGLSNTIAGRICNQFDLKGGGYTVDGACASSLLAVANACSSLAAGDLDVALAGGVDLSLDPFELVGFAKVGALAAEEMRVFDQRSAGFWPGEGCGFVTLMRHEDALAQGRRVYAVIRGWGISSDGAGGITRPESAGQLEALRRAYRRAGFGADTVVYCEGHGTGTQVGDTTELEVLARARREANPNSPPAVIGSIKANIGHTKAAAGIAGLIKASMAVHTQVLPTTTSCHQPHSLLRGPASALRVLREPEIWPENRPLRASVSAMGFGGINAHVVLESSVSARRKHLGSRERSLGCSAQDAELFLLGAQTAAELLSQVEKFESLAPGLSRSEMTDLAAHLQRSLKSTSIRAALVASDPGQLAGRMATLGSWLQNKETSQLSVGDGVFLSSSRKPPRIGFLFPGQGSPARLNGGAWSRRFDSVRELYKVAALPTEGDTVSTEVMQPAILTASLAGTKVLEAFGLNARVAIGHSLGELAALHWAGAMERETLLRLARVRGGAMAELGSPTGAMVAIGAPWQKVQDLLDGDPLTVVGYNSPLQTVVAGEVSAVNRLLQRAETAGFHATRLPVSHAFHTPLVAAALPVLADQLAHEQFLPMRRNVISTVTGALLDRDADLRELLCRQVTSPVRFSSALENMLGLRADTPTRADSPAFEIDLLIEVGPGSVLSGLVKDSVDVPIVALDAGGPSLQGLLQALGAAFALGVPLQHAALFEDRFVRAFDPHCKSKFFVNPCELAPLTQGTTDLTEAQPSIRSEAAAITIAENVEPEAGTPQPAIDLVRKLVAARAELPASAVQDQHRLLSDLHLNSITVGQLVSEAARHLGLPRLVGLTDFANATVAEMAGALEDLQETGATAKSDDKKQAPPGVDSWVAAFSVEMIETSARLDPAGKTRQGKSDSTKGNWQVFAPKNHSLATSVSRKLRQAGGSGVLLCLPKLVSKAHIRLMLEAARAALAMEREPRFVLVQHGWGGSGFARTLHLETPGMTTSVVNVPPATPQAADWILSEILSLASGYSEASYDTNGRRSEPRLRLESLPSRSSGEHVADSPFPIGPDDVLLVTGGGKGISAECALELGRATGTALALMGRSDPKTDTQLRETIERIRAAGVRCCYVCADVTDAPLVKMAISRVKKDLGPVTALLHGAGSNTPQLIAALDEEVFQSTVATKVQGIRNVLSAIDPKQLRMLVSFGSIISRIGFLGEADYATANEWLTALTEDFHKTHPKCRCLALEWSVWSGVGMGERLGRVESLIAQGISPMSPDEAVRILLELLRHPSGQVAVVVTGRFGTPPTLKLEQPELPLRRFLERKRVHYPGVELIVDAELSVDSDPYLDDHVLQRQRLFPAVLGLEAMAQTAMALAGSTETPDLEQVQFTRPVAVSDTAKTTIRLAALRRSPDVVEVCLRSEETDYQVDHFRALCRFEAATEGGMSQLALKSPASEPLALDPQKDLYGQILFHQGRFRRLLNYRSLSARECVAEISPDTGTKWFGPYLPDEFTLGDPAGRDAALHAIQSCIPHRRILPTGIDSIKIRRCETGPRFVQARERERNGNDFVYDVEVTTPEGEVVERWMGLRLRAVEQMATARESGWPEALLAPYLERRIEEMVSDSQISLSLSRGAKAAGVPRSKRAMLDAIGKDQAIWHRPDGKPVTLEGVSVSAAHSQNLTLAVARPAGVACDLETVQEQSEAAWLELLGEDRFRMAERISREQSETVNLAATRMWSAMECMKKAGLTAQSPLVLESATADGWVLLRSGSMAITTAVTSVRGLPNPLAFAVALQSGTAARSVAPPHEARA